MLESGAQKAKGAKMIQKSLGAGGFIHHNL